MQLKRFTCFFPNQCRSSIQKHRFARLHGGLWAGAWLGVLLAGGAMILAGCKKEKPAESESAGSTQPRGGDRSPKTRGSPRDARPARTRARRAKGRLLADPNSPTGLKACDTYLETVCRCAKKHPALKLACKQAKKSAPLWKKNAEKDPETIETTLESCQKALQSIQQTYDCK
jgi:hypothetical protein